MALIKTLVRFWQSYPIFLEVKMLQNLKFKWDILTDFQPLCYATTHFAFFENIIRSSEVGQDDLRGVYIHILEEKSILEKYWYDQLHLIAYFSWGCAKNQFAHNRGWKDPWNAILRSITYTRSRNTDGLFSVCFQLDSAKIPKSSFMIGSNKIPQRYASKVIKIALLALSLNI